MNNPYTSSSHKTPIKIPNLDFNRIATFLANTARSFRRMSLQSRLTLLILVITVPTLFLFFWDVNVRAESILRNKSDEQLRATNQALADNVTVWLRMNVQTLKGLVSLPDIASMDVFDQKPVLEEIAATQPHMYLISTTDLNGLNVARNDDAENKDYSDREWFQQAKNGAPVSYQSLVGKTSGTPALAVSMPIRNSAGEIVGVGMFASELKTITDQVAVSRVGKTGFTYLVDAENQVIAHPDPSFTTELKDFSSAPPVMALRQGTKGLFSFTDENGKRWQAYVDSLENGWGVIVQQNEAEYLQAFQSFRQFSWIIILAIAAVLLFLVWVIIRQATQPVTILTDAARAIAAGDLDFEVPVEREDEFGVLAQTFNAMTSQLRELIYNLEGRVAERTRALETSAEVSRRLSTILDQKKLVKEVVDQLQSAFNYYHVHIYLFDDSREYLRMAGGTGEAGEILIARKHFIPEGKGLVGRAAALNQAVLVPDITRDPDWLPNPLLPDTKAELAVPIAIGGVVIGVLDVQQNIMGGLGPNDAILIQSVANQVAIALQNARVYQQTQRKVEREELVSAINQRIQSAYTVDDVLKVAVSELSKALEAQRSSVVLNAPQRSAGIK